MVSTPKYISIVILNVVDHNEGLELNSRLNCTSSIHDMWSSMKHSSIRAVHYHHLLIQDSLMTSPSHFKSNTSPIVPGFSQTQALTPQSEFSHPEQGVVAPKCESTAHCFCFAIFTLNCKHH